ncbi:1-acylglycerol-3-phosphate O-acyltransferase PNPLA3-like [Molossus molossus]|uniref:1-acylglycerol-3-phosphate O-acyltransferase PNPLA3-like n=1 Tax=Molossus molossus TaxID=27622 RepID=UPI00174742C2|nr:1-acylglycerol-3-phosphate O-acyltransferase PNPLA3-like [Molossus molossus]
MDDHEHGWSLCFSGCGFLCSYHIGVTHCLQERAPQLLCNARMIFGSSAGALHCVTFLAGIPLEQVLQSMVNIVRCARNRNIGIFHPSCNIIRLIQEFLQRWLPANIHKLISGKVCISLTRVSDWQNVLVSDFQSKDEVVDALLCSSFIPYFFGIIPPTFRGVRYVDGGMSNSLPFFDSKTTITVSPFFGEYDICPRNKNVNFIFLDYNQLSVRLCSQNIFLISHALLSLDMKVLGEICLRGYLDAVRFLEEKGICDRLHPCPDRSSREPDVSHFTWENHELEASEGEAARQTRPVGDELLDHLRLNLLPWDESILEILSPSLITALRTAGKSQSGYMTKICDFMPVKVMSYLMLPFTLPVESAVFGVRRLVMWLPDIPDDIRWLQSLGSQLCSRVVTRLLPTSRYMVCVGPMGIPFL